MQLDQEQYKIQATNEAYTQPNVLELRLDTNDLLEKIKAFLKGGRITYVKNNETGQVEAQFVKEGEALCNDLGVQSISSWVSMLINPSTVQGNWKEDRFNLFLERTQKNLAKNILINSPRYEIDRQDRAFIIKGIMGMLEMFGSRLLDNEERQSYSQSLGAKIANLVNPQEKKSVF